MAKVKYCLREFTPHAGQSGVHSFYAQSVTDNTITNEEIAAEVEARGLSRAAEIEAILKEAANVILKEVRENNRVQLQAKGGVLVTIYPKVSGSISDTEVQAHPELYNGATAATADMLTADRLSWSLGATVGKNFSAEFALTKQAIRVRPGASASDEDENPETPEEPQNPGGGDGDGDGGLEQ